MRWPNMPHRLLNMLSDRVTMAVGMHEWIDTEEASQLSGYNVVYLRTLLRDKKIASKKRGGAYWVDKQSLLDFVSAASDAGDKRHGGRSKTNTDNPSQAT
jgi:hypothetical protein